ncbi:hypothetical protein T01_2905 [Trichinella spiralis]|uniref:Uncharacterized protein n=1 Tax=Trichinella spiralis TaxID=6334 RepID=A0A0V1AKZ7_TRISP|nr:hypothetical protein T01_2905 [Trichinella spiralis]
MQIDEVLQLNWPRFGVHVWKLRRKVKQHQAPMHLVDMALRTSAHCNVASDLAASFTFDRRPSK